jgi:hypothetical protein
MRHDGNMPLTHSLNQFIDVVDDFGLLFVADPRLFDVYVGEDWMWDDLHQRLLRELYEGRTVVWETGLPWTYKLRLSANAPTRPHTHASTGWQLEVRQGVALGSFADLAVPVAEPAARLALEVLHLDPGIYRVDLYRMLPPLEENFTDDVFTFHDRPAVPAHFHLTFAPTELDIARNHAERIPLLGHRSRIYGAGKYR